MLRLAGVCLHLSSLVLSPFFATNLSNSHLTCLVTQEQVSCCCTYLFDLGVRFSIIILWESKWSRWMFFRCHCRLCCMIATQFSTHMVETVQIILANSPKICLFQFRCLLKLVQIIPVGRSGQKQHQCQNCPGGPLCELGTNVTVAHW